MDWREPKDPQNPSHVQAADRSLHFWMGIYANPIYGKDGDYPDELKTYVNRKSKEEGLTKSRLPEFTKKEVEYIRGKIPVIFH